MQLERLQPVVPNRLRRYLSRRQMARELLREPQLGFRKVEDTVPPEGERITFHAVWAVEAYTPLHADMLVERLESLGFGRDDPWQRGSIRDQLASVRGHPRGGAWLNLGFVIPPEASGFMFDRVEAPLPNGVRCARPTLHALTPSVTLLVIQFVLDDDAATAFDNLSRETDFKPQTRIRENGVSWVPSDQVKERALRELRQEVRDRAALWVTEQVPGVFASGLGGRRMPTAELVTTELAEPFARGDGYLDYARLAGFGYDPLHWVSDELSHWRLKFDRDDNFVVVAARRSVVLTDEKYKEHGGDERWVLAYRTHDYLSKDLALWAASRLLLAFHGRLSAIRDHGLTRRRFQTASMRLRKIRDEFLRDALDARVAAAELKHYAENEREFEWNACEWESSDDLPREERLLENLRSSMTASATALAGAEARLRDGLIVDSSVVGARAGLRLNWWMLLITLVALLIAIASLIVASRADNGSPTHTSGRGPAQTAHRDDQATQNRPISFRI